MLECIFSGRKLFLNGRMNTSATFMGWKERTSLQTSSGWTSTRVILGANSVSVQVGRIRTCRPGLKASYLQFFSQPFLSPFGPQWREGAKTKLFLLSFFKDRNPGNRCWKNMGPKASCCSTRANQFSFYEAASSRLV